MPGLPNYRRLLGPKNIVEDREIADEYGRTPPTFALTGGGGGDFGEITDSERKSFQLEFTPAVGTTGLAAVEQTSAVFAQYTGDDDGFELVEIAGVDTSMTLSDEDVFPVMPFVEGIFPIGFYETFKIEALAADEGVEVSGVLSFYTRISNIDEGVVFDPDSLVFTIELSKTYNPL